MAKKIRIQAELDDSKLRKQLDDIGKRKEKITVDIDSGNVENTDQSMKYLNRTVSDSNSVFGKLKNTISNTFSSGKIAMTGYLMVLNEINKAGKNAKQTIQEIDKAVTDLSVATNMSRESVTGLIKDYNKYAKQLSSTTTHVTSAADDYLRAGKTMDETQALIKDSIMLSKLGQLESGAATEDLLAVMNGYEMSIKEVDRALDAMVSLDMEAATSSGDIATALKYCASSADVAGLSFNKLSAMIATVQEKTMQSAETVGTFMNTILSRYRNVKIGQFVSDDGEDLSEVETILNSLDIKLRDSSQEFRDFEAVIEEVALSWDSYSSVQQAAIAKAFSGTRQQNRFLALMEGYNKTLELTEVAANSAGTAVEKFNNSYMDSLEAKQSTLQASFESMIMNTNFSGVYAEILDATTALIDFINQTNVLKGAMSGLAVSGGIKGFLAIKSGIYEAYISLNKFQNALDIVKKSNISTKEYEKLLLLSNGLSTSQMKLVLSTNSLSTAQKKELLIASGLSEEEAALQMQTWKITAANTGLTASTMSLGNAFKALWSTLIANPLVIVTALVSGAVMAYQSYSQNLEEIRQAAEEAASAYKESSSAINDYVSRYKELHEALIKAKGNEEETYNIKKQLLDLQTELNEKFSDEYGAINLVTDAYKDQTEAIKALNKETAQIFLNENKAGIDKAEKEMMKKRHYNLSLTSISSYMDKGIALKEIAEKYKEQGITLMDEFGDGNYAQFSVHLEADAQSAYETINAFENDLRNKAKEIGNEHMFDDVLDISSNSLNQAKETINKYGDIFKQALTAEIASDNDLSRTYNDVLNTVNAYNEAILKSENPYDDENVAEVRENLDTLKESIRNNEMEWGRYGALVDEIFSQADTRILDFNEALKTDSSIQNLANNLKGFSDLDLKALNDDGNNDYFEKLKESANEYGVSVDELIDLLVHLGYVQGEIISDTESTALFSSFNDSEIGERLQYINNQFEAGELTTKEYFDALRNEIENVDFSNFTDSLEEANAASQQFFTDSVQQTASGLSDLINKFDSGSIGVSEYLEGYLSIAETMSTLTDELQKNSEAWDENGNALSSASNSALDSTQENMANAISVIQSYQDSIYSLEQIMTGAIEAGSNEFAAHAEVIADDLARIVATGGEMADEVSKVLGTTTDEIAKSLTESVSNQSLASQAIAANTNTAIGDMANSIGELFNTLGNAISNFKVDVSFGIKKISAQDVDMGILGTHKLPKIEFALEANGKSLDTIGSAISSFGKTISSNLKPQMIELPDFTFGNTEAGKNSTYKPSSGITKNYENALDKIKDSAKSASKSTKDSADEIENTFEELFDFFERRVQVLDDALSLLKTNLDNVTGSFAKNNLIDAELGITEEKFKNYSDALNMYTEKTNEALSKLPSDIASKIKDGAVDLTTFVGDGNKEVVEAIKDYEQWADKVADCKQELAELRTAIRQLELEKFNNIMEDFTNQFDLHEDGKDLISKQIDLLKEAGQLIGDSFFTAQIDQSKKQLALLEDEKAKLVAQMSSAIGSERVD